MAYFRQEDKAAIAPAIKAILKKYNLKGSLAIKHHSTVVLNIKSGAIDFINNGHAVAEKNPERFGMHYTKPTHENVNNYHYKSHYTGVAVEALTELLEVLNTGNYDKSDIMTDYFDVGFYVDVNIGQWNKPYVYEATGK